MKRQICLFLLLVSCSNPLLADEKADRSTKLPDPEKFHLFLLVGQSNMAGRGKISERDLKPHPRVLKFNKDQQWVPAIDPLHFDKPGIAGVGLGKTFGEIIAEKNPDITVGLIPCAVGGSSITAWEPGGYHPQTKTHPYDDMLKRCRVALKQGRLKGILWHQGEGDSRSPNAEKYEQRLHALIQRLRKELEAENVPFVAGQLGMFAERPWNEQKKLVNQAHVTLPEKVEKTGFVSAEGLSHKGDEVHFDATSYRELGKRFADKYLEMTISK